MERSLYFYEKKSMLNAIVIGHENFENFKTNSLSIKSK